MKELPGKVRSYEIAVYEIMSGRLLREICLSACYMNRTTKANYQCEGANFMVPEAERMRLRHEVKQ
jgi:hypothetical protein